jgi:chemotaxis signal transduction protein
MSGSTRYVLFPLGRKRLAVPAEIVAELVPVATVHRFPHRTPLLDGVLLRDDAVVPVLDVARALTGRLGFTDAPKGRFFLIASLSRNQRVAVPVTGECEMVVADITPAPVEMPECIDGILVLPTEMVEVLSLSRMLSMGVSA